MFRLKIDKEVVNMKKVLATMFFALLAVTIVVGYADAKVKGQCAECHTMHSSQGGTQNSNWDLGVEPRGNLLANTCEGCHTNTENTVMYDSSAATPIPYVKALSAPTNYLAGGFFTDGGGSHDDNSHTLGSLVDPAGYSVEGFDYSGAADGLSCAGTSGCHGALNQSDQYGAVNGGHHESKDISNAFRFLRAYDSGDAAGKNVAGVEAADFELALNTDPDTADAHNTYAASPATGAGISELCGKCHSDFHGGDDTGSGDPAGSPWKRHPTDVAIPSDWDIYADFNNDWTDDAQAWKDNPLGFSNPASPTAATAQVICISCHRAHGSPFSDNLRWDYDTMLAGQAEGSQVQYGCLGCHSKQR